MIEIDRKTIYAIVENQNTNNILFHPILFIREAKESEHNAIRSKSETIKPRKFGFQLKLTPSPISLSLYSHYHHCLPRLEYSFKQTIKDEGGGCIRSTLFLKVKCNTMTFVVEISYLFRSSGNIFLTQNLHSLSCQLRHNLCNSR